MKALCTAPAALAALLGAFLAALASPVSHAAAALKDGDIVFHTSRSAQSVAVQRATGSRYSHMGIVLLRDGKPFVFEAVSTVRYTPLAQWTARGNGGHYVVKRLRDADTLLTTGAVARLHARTADFSGRPYDLTFEWSDGRIYCSELVWKLYQRALGVRIGELQKIREFNLKDPAVRAKMRERYGNTVPMDEPVISPVAMFDSPLLVTVETR
ncbi:YiiX family permuted papain-like enzyme [Variovorax boronicumulans]|uniref:YiiX family permuted papain-like enzyme n=1 Tax=Variovorax boronicumulans TaxID=436515 RepID=UPI0033993CE7